MLRTFDQTSRTLTQGLSEMAQVLTPQQRKQLGQIMEQHKQERQRRMEEHRGNRPTRESPPRPIAPDPAGSGRLVHDQARDRQAHGRHTTRDVQHPERGLADHARRAKG